MNNSRNVVFIILGVIVLIAMIVVLVTYSTNPQTPIDVPTPTPEFPGTDIPPLNLAPESTDETLETTPSNREETDDSEADG